MPLHISDTDSTTDLYGDNYSVSVKIRRIGKNVAFVVLLVALITTCIVVGVLYHKALDRPTTTHRSQHESKHGGTEIPYVKPNHEICDDDRCFYLGTELVKQLDKSVDPCQDFYSYACGGWQKRNALRQNQSYTSTFKTLRETNVDVLRKALEQATKNYSQNAAIMKTARVYNSCMDIQAIDANGLQPLKQLIAAYGGWRVSGNYDTMVPIATRIGNAARDLNVDSLFGLTSRTDMYDSSRTILQITPATISMSRDYYFSQDSDKQKIREAYKKYMKAVGRMFGGLDSDRKMMAIFDFEVSLAKIASGKDPESELIESFLKGSRSRRSSFPDFRVSIDNFCDKTDFSCTLLKDVLLIIFGRSFEGFEKMLAIPSVYYEKLNTFYQRKISWPGDKQIVGDYIMWRIVHKYIIALPSNYSAVQEEFMRSITGSPPSPRWKQCIGHMMGPFDMTLGRLYVDAHFDDDSKNTVEEMTENIRSSFIERLSSQSWMDYNTQQKAKVKARAIKVDIGYPSLVKNDNMLDKRYDTFTASDDLFSNYKALNRFVKKKMTNEYGNPVARDAWFYSPAVVNGYYSPNQNRIVFLAGIIQPPFYNPNYPRYIKYGGIGSVIGHEITHGFDGSGRLFNGDGNLDNWWSNSASQNFESKTKCLVKQYNRYNVFDKYVNGTRTLNENIADNGGIKIAYDAYQRWSKKNGREKILPGLGLSPEQLFFVGYAQPWCSIYTKKPAMLQLKTDSHTFNKYRVIGSLSNFDKFSQAFKCPANSRMNPSTKCGVW